MRRVRRKGANKEKVFGCDLLEHLTASNQEIPLVLRSCSEFVEQHGIVDGIYRLSGVSSNIQKLRGEFESDGAPDLNKDVYLQDIHCVSSLCKAYFRELPNPLLTYQLYDKFAEAVAIQLEKERLVKIRDVLKELPDPHYRTLECLMRHLVRMASYSSETNMHARNLAIVWAPNLLRSKDIEASGFNGTAAFMEVRVQSIVVEFILTHVPQLFPLEGASTERRKSLPSPSALPSQDLVFFRSPACQPNFGNISPGDGPLAIRPYHAIIEGTDKRKGSLKGRKWMSIFNIGGRFPDPRRKSKHSAKEKDRTSLRPARSMDSLSTPSYPNQDSRHPGPCPPSTNLSPLVTTSPQPSSDTTVSAGGLGRSEYAVTYRRGTGLVSGGGGTQGTYTALDPDGSGVPGSRGVQSRSPGLSNKARRAAMHITGPTMVTVPLHITSNLALGVLQGGGGDRVIQRGRDRDGADKQEGKEAGGKIEIKEPKGMEWNVEDSKTAEEKDKSQKQKEDLNAEGNKIYGEDKNEGVEEKRDNEEMQIGDHRVLREKRDRSLNSNTEEDPHENIEEDDGQDSEYMEMKVPEVTFYHAAAASQDEDYSVSDSDGVLNSTEVEEEEDNHKLSGYIQDNFEFLDQMDCSVMDHMDHSVSHQFNEFSVEPPGHSDDEYEIMVQAERPAPSVTESNPHRPLSLDLHNRHTKSLSLPYMTSPIDGPEEISSSDQDVSEDDGDEDNYSSDEEESMFVKSLPSDFFLNTLSGVESDSQDYPSPDRHLEQGLQRSGETSYEPSDVEPPDVEPSDVEPSDVEPPDVEPSDVEPSDVEPPDVEPPDVEPSDVEPSDVEPPDVEPPDVEPLDVEPPDVEPSDVELSVCKEPPEHVQESTGNNEEKQKAEKMEEDEVHHGEDQLEKETQRATEESPRATEDSQTEKCLTSEVPTSCCEELELPGIEGNLETNNLTGAKVDDGKEVLEESGDDCLLPTQQPESCAREDVAERDDPCDQSALEEPERDDGEGPVDRKNNEEDNASSRTNSDIWSELEDVVCEVIEDEESEQSERNDAAEPDGEKDEKLEEEDVKSTTETGGEAEELSLELNVEKPTEEELGQETHENEFNQKVQDHNKEDVVSEETEKEKEDRPESGTQQSADKQTVMSSDIRDPKEGSRSANGSDSPGGVGRKLVVSKQPKFYQVKAVPVVPPKPQHCKITALTLRQQQQQRERRDNTLKIPTEQDRDGEGDGEKKDRATVLREKRRDGLEGAGRDAKRNSPLSMCFDEAVAIATLRREKERGREGEADSEGLGK